jgi:hypothetical protein
MTDDIKKIEKFIDRLIEIIKPNGVIDIEYKIDPKPIGENQYYMEVTYIVPDDSDMLKNNIKQSFINDSRRQKWNSEISKAIKSYFGIRIILNTSGIRSKSFNDKLKKYEQ